MYMDGVVWFAPLFCKGDLEDVVRLFFGFFFSLQWHAGLDLDVLDLDDSVCLFGSSWSVSSVWGYFVSMVSFF